MSVTIAQLGSLPLGAQVPGSIKESYGVLTLDASYPTGGYTVNPSLFGLVRLDAVVVLNTSNGTPLVYNTATGKLQAYTARGTEVSNATDLHTEKAVVVAFGY